jgi:hypothetical protein
MEWEPDSEWHANTASVQSWCETCVYAVDGEVDPLTGSSLAAAHIAAMGPFDTTALAFSTFIVAFTVVGEMKDITLCNIALTRADGAIGSHGL